MLGPRSRAFALKPVNFVEFGNYELYWLNFRGRYSEWLYLDNVAKPPGLQTQARKEDSNGKRGIPPKKSGISGPLWVHAYHAAPIFLGLPAWGPQESFYSASQLPDNVWMIQCREDLDFFPAEGRKARSILL